MKKDEPTYSLTFDDEELYAIAWFGLEGLIELRREKEIMKQSRYKVGDLVHIHEAWNNNPVDVWGLVIPSSSHLDPLAIHHPGVAGSEGGSVYAHREEAAFYSDFRLDSRFRVGDLIETDSGPLPIQSFLYADNLNAYAIVAYDKGRTGPIVITLPQNAKRVRVRKATKPAEAYKKEVQRLQAANEKHKSALRYDQNRVMEAKSMLLAALPESLTSENSLLELVEEIIFEKLVAQDDARELQQIVDGYKKAAINLKDARAEVTARINEVLGTNFKSSREATYAFIDAFESKLTDIEFLTKENARLSAKAVAAEAGIKALESEHQQKVSQLGKFKPGDAVNIVSVNSADYDDLWPYVNTIGTIKDFQPYLIQLRDENEGFLEYLVVTRDGLKWWFREQDLLAVEGTEASANA